MDNTAMKMMHPEKLLKPPLVLPYMILQPTLFNRKECKCVFVNGVCHHIWKPPPTGIAYSFSSGNDARLIEFSTHAIVLLKRRISAAIVDGLVRVDVMESNAIEVFTPRDDEMYMSSFPWVVHEGKYWRRKLFVNEFEGVQANYMDEADIDTWLTMYWKNILHNALPPLV
jgi:hypothetical protein